MSTDDLERLMGQLEDICEDLTEKLESCCFADEEDVLSGVITNLNESIDDIAMFLSEVKR